MKRRAIIKVLAVVTGAFMQQKAEAQKLTDGTGTGTFRAPPLSPTQSLMLGLADRDNDSVRGGIDEISVSYNGETIRLSAKEIFEALKG